MTSNPKPFFCHKHQHGDKANKITVRFCEEKGTEYYYEWSACYNWQQSRLQSCWMLIPTGAGTLRFWRKPATCPSRSKTRPVAKLTTGLRQREDAQLCIFFTLQAARVVVGGWGSLIASDQQLKGQLSCQEGLHVLSWELMAWLNLPLK